MFPRDYGAIPECQKTIIYVKKDTYCLLLFGNVLEPLGNVFQNDG